MLHALVLAGLLAAAAAAPATYDQRQDGEFNVRADVQNVVLIVAYPQKMKLPINDIFGGFKSAHKENEFQERADLRFVEPSTPYRVEIGSDGERYADVVISGRRRLEAGPQAEAELQAKTEPQAESETELQAKAEPQPEAEADGDKEEYKLVGSQEQCGPERERDPVTLTCRWKAGAVEADRPPRPGARPEQAAAKPEPVVVHA